MKRKKKFNQFLSLLFMCVMALGGMSNTAQAAEAQDPYLGVKTEAKVYDDFENDIWLQYQQKDMKKGDTAKIRPWRLEQIVSDSINNDVARPNFHFEIISGDSISLSSKESSDYVTATAEKSGTSVVKVTYDAMDYKERHWDACSPVNTAYAVFTVGEEGTASIQVDEKLDKWRHYDTIYYNEDETVPFTFEATAENAEEVKVTCNGLEVQPTKDNSYTVNLENRSNIIGVTATDAEGKVKSLYRVVDARFMEVKVVNKTEEGQPLRAGQTANISFRGVTMPVYKLATIYNPVWTSDGMWGKSDATYLSYQAEGLTDENGEAIEFKGQCGQWDLATNNDFDVTFPEAKTYTFTSEKGIFSEWWGSKLGSDITAEGSGEPNLNAPVLKDWFCTLPDFTVEVYKTDKEVADAVVEKIQAIGKVDLTKETLVTEARKAYDALTEEQKKLVSKEALEILEAAEALIEELKQTPAEEGYVIVDIEKFTLGQGFYKEPVKIKFEEGQTVKDVLMTLDRANLVFKGENYLSGIRGADTGKVEIPEYITKELNGPTTAEAVATGNQDNILGEFDYTNGSGWYYFVNDKAPDVGVAQYKVKSGDVIRLQFTLMYGTDLGDSFGGTSKVNISNKDAALKLLAEINSRKDKKELLANKDIEAVYNETIKIVQNAVASQKEVNAVSQKLRTVVNNLPEEPEMSVDEKAASVVTDQINGIGNVTLDSEKAIEEARKAYNALTADQKKLV